MGKKREYTNEEIKELGIALSGRKNAKEVKRILVVKTKGELDLSDNAIGKLLGYSEYTVRDILAQYSKYGISGLVSQGKHGGRRNENMTLKEEKELLAKFESSSASGQIATISSIKKEYESKVGKKVPKSTISRLLERHNWRKIVPRTHHPKRNIEAQNAYKKTSAPLLLNIKKCWVKIH